MSVDVSMNLKGLEDLRKGLKKGQYVEVGVFADHKNQRNTGTLTNLEDAVIQEFGSVSARIPARSFIKMPIETHRSEIIKYAAGKTMRTLLLAGNGKKALGLLGVFAEEIIQSAFDTRGFGKWAPNAPTTIDAKGSAKPLINTQQLRQVIWSRVVGFKS